MAVPTRAAAVAVLLVLAAGCPRRADTGAPGDRPASLAALADRIDPGPVPPLLARSPAVIDRMLGDSPADVSPAEAEKLLTDVTGTLTAGGSASLADLQRILQILRALAVVERNSDQRCDLACLTALERVYGILDLPWLASEEGLMAQIIDIASGALVQSGFSKREVKEAIAFIRSVFRRAPRRHALIAARLLRRHPDSPGALSALRRTGNRAALAEDFDQAITFLATAAARAPAGERAGDLLDLARTCYRALEIPCGDRRLAEGRRAAGANPAPDLAERIAAIRETGALARRVVAASGARRFEEKNELGHLLLDLGRRRQAMALFEELGRERPGDARPLVGLARSHVDEMRGPVLQGYLDRARRLAHRDLRYHELAIGTAFTRLMPIVQEMAATPNMSEEQILARVVTPLASLRGDIDGLARFAPSRAAVLKVLIDGAVDIASVRPKGDAAMREAFARGWRAGLEVRRRFPGEPDAHHLVYVLAGFGAAPDAELESAVLAAVPPDLPSRDAVLEARASVYQRIVLDRVLLDRTAALERVVADIPAARAAGWEARNLRADAVALAAVIGRGSWDAAAAAYRELVPLAPDDQERARIENNVGVALHRGGHASEALAAWDRAMRLGPAYPVPDLNHAATGDGAPYGLQRLADLSESGELAGIRFQAAAWRRHFAVARGEKGQVPIARLRDEKLDSSLRMLIADGGLGFITAGSFKVSFGYHTTKRLVIELGTESRTWLCLPAPGTAPVTAPARRRP